MQFKCTHIHLLYLFVRVGLKCRHTALGNPQKQSWTPRSSGEPEQSQSESKRTWLLGEGAGWCHTCSGTITSFIYSSNQKNRLQAAEYQFLLLPEPMSGCLKCHWAGRLCISFPARLQEALKQIDLPVDELWPSGFLCGSYCVSPTGSSCNGAYSHISEEPQSLCSVVVLLLLTKISRPAFL